MFFNVDTTTAQREMKRTQKLIDHFPYLGSNISSNESDLNICVGMALIAIDN